MKTKQHLSGGNRRRAVFRSVTRFAAAISAMGLFAFAVMAGTAAKAATPATSATVSTAQTGPQFFPLNVKVGQKAPDFALPAADGGIVRLSQFRGQNVLLDFYEGYW